MGTDLRVEINKALNEFQKYSQEAVYVATIKAARHAAKVLKKTSPSRHSDGYASGWKAEVKRNRIGVTGVVYNTKKPGLTHLLEFGTFERRKRSGISTGIAPAKPHILKAQKDAEDKWLDYFTEEIEK